MHRGTLHISIDVCWPENATLDRYNDPCDVAPAPEMVYRVRTVKRTSIDLTEADFVDSNELSNPSLRSYPHILH